MDFVLAAVKTKYDANATLVALAPLYHVASITDTTPMPYVAFFIPSIGPGGEIYSGRYEDVLVQFSIWSEAKSQQEAWDIFEALDNEFNNSTLTYTDSFYSRQCVRMSVRPAVYDEGAWHISADYRILVLAKQS